MTIAYTEEIYVWHMQKAIPKTNGTLLLKLPKEKPHKSNHESETYK